MSAVNPEMLRWARETAGLDLAEAARKVGLSGETATERLAAIEAGEKDPTPKQLNEMAEKYRQSLVTFYLDHPPLPDPETPDFRMVPDRDDTQEHLLTALVQNVRIRQSLIISGLEDIDEAEPLSFVGKCSLDMPPEGVADAIVQILDFSLDEFRRQRTAEEAFRYLREKVEETGVYVILMGNLGHYTNQIDPKVFRGLALADPVAPFIVVNEYDARSAWSFTLLHEFAHILLGATGISGYHPNTSILERLCNRAAAHILLPAWEIETIALRDESGEDILFEEITSFASERNLSRLMVAYNLLAGERIPGETYRELDRAFAADRGRKRRKEKAPINPYVVKRHRLGAHLVGLVDRLVGERVMTSTKAAQVLGVRPTAVGKVIEV